MQAAHLAQATRAGHEHPRADFQPDFASGVDDLSNALVAWNERIAHARKWRTPAPRTTDAPCRR